MDRLFFLSHAASHPSVPGGTAAVAQELGYFLMAGPGTATHSKDNGALFIPTLHVAAGVVRAIAQGRTLFELFNGVALLLIRAERSTYHKTLWSYVWGDLKVFETGEPVVARALFVRGKVQSPDIGDLKRYLEEMPKPA